MTSQPKTARAAAILAMTDVTDDGVLLSEALPSACTGLSPAEAARAGRLATEALRWANRSDRVLGPHLRMRPEGRVMNALRLAVYELLEKGEAAHGVVNDVVSLVTRSKAGLVNGVLRNIIRREVVWADLPVPQLQKWLRKPLVAAWGKEAVLAMERVQSMRPPLDLTVKDAGQRDDWAKTLQAQSLPNGSLRLSVGAQVSALAGYEDGAWWVQDAGATLAAQVLDAQPGERVLDVGAAPGGKTMQLATTGAEVTALDVSKARMERVTENLKRTGLTAHMVTANALTWKPDAPFDAVLLDAPCSATGTLRRHPDLQYARDGSGLAELVSLQSRLLDSAARWVKPGGRLVFCTCSLLPEEGEGQIESFLGRNPTFRAIALASHDTGWTVDGGLRLRPDQWEDRGGLDGFFVARLENHP